MPDAQCVRPTLAGTLLGLLLELPVVAGDGPAQFQRCAEPRAASASATRSSSCAPAGPTALAPTSAPPELHRRHGEVAPPAIRPHTLAFIRMPGGMDATLTTYAVVLSIGKVGAGNGDPSYYLDTVATGRE